MGERSHAALSEAAVSALSSWVCASLQGASWPVSLQHLFSFSALSDS